MKKYSKLLILPLGVITLAGCSSIESRQKDIVASYMNVNSNLSPEVRAAIEEGKIIPGMTLEQVYIAGGVKSDEYRNYSIWVVNNGKLFLPPTAGGRIGALIITNKSQYITNQPESFVVWLKEPKLDTVERIDRNVPEYAQGYHDRSNNRLKSDAQNSRSP
jgi:hypothetical protein